MYRSREALIFDGLCSRQEGRSSKSESGTVACTDYGIVHPERFLVECFPFKQFKHTVLFSV